MKETALNLTLRKDAVLSFTRLSPPLSLPPPAGLGFNFAFSARPPPTAGSGRVVPLPSPVHSHYRGLPFLRTPSLFVSPDINHRATSAVRGGQLRSSFRLAQVTRVLHVHAFGR